MVDAPFPGREATLRKDERVASREDVGPILNGIPTHLPDIDPAETEEWLDSLDAVIDGPGRMRARYLMLRMLERARAEQVGVPSLTTTDYVNTISPEQEPWFPGDEDVEMWPPTPMPGRCARWTIIAAFQRRYERNRRSTSSSPGNQGSCSGLIVLT